MKTLSTIVAIGKNNEIGYKNDLLWRLPKDLKRFKEITTGHSILMGRKTYESLPKGALPNRKNIILTRDARYIAENCTVYTSLHDMIKEENEDEIFIIGGGEIYKLTLPLSNKLYLTTVEASFENADTFFPAIDFSQWSLISEEHIAANELNKYAHTFCVYIRIK
ncbi:dihydrofolate reductase [Bacteroidales bacterium]|nr:dihydrofolate reductase [Bacteroidales bacterium]